MSDSEERLPNPVDRHVGQRIRIRRKQLGVSQEKLAESIGLTFQQVQKYERAANRVSASKLWQMAAALDTTIAYFFDGLKGPQTDAAGVAEDDSVQFTHDLLTTPEGHELATLFPRIKRTRVRKRVLDLVRSLVEEEEDA